MNTGKFIKALLVVGGFAFLALFLSILFEGEVTMPIGRGRYCDLDADVDDEW